MIHYWTGEFADLHLLKWHEVWQETDKARPCFYRMVQAVLDTKWVHELRIGVDGVHATVPVPSPDNADSVKRHADAVAAMSDAISAYRAEERLAA